MNKLNEQSAKSSNSKTKLFERSLKHFATGMVRIEKDDLMNTFDFGLPPNVSCIYCVAINVTSSFSFISNFTHTRLVLKLAMSHINH